MTNKEILDIALQQSRMIAIVMLPIFCLSKML